MHEEVDDDPVEALGRLTKLLLIARFCVTIEPDRVSDPALGPDGGISS